MCNQNGSPNLESRLNAFGDTLNEKLGSFEQRVKQLEIQQNTFFETLNARLKNQPIQKSTGQNEGVQSLEKSTKDWNLSPSYTKVVDRIEAYESTTDRKTFVTKKPVEDHVNFYILKFINTSVARLKPLNKESTIESTNKGATKSTNKSTTDNTTESVIESTTESTSTIKSTNATEEPSEFDGSSPQDFMINYMLKEYKDSESAVLHSYINKLMDNYRKWVKLGVK